MNLSGVVSCVHGVFGETVTLRPASGGRPLTGRARLQQPTHDILGNLVATDYALRYPVATFPNVQKGDRITIGRTDYLVRDVPQHLPDGLEAIAPLSKQF
ncbi:MAG TPA: hypothetical protein PKE01_05205 [Rhodocyclaceae bacterium]|uniref:head-tail joining protein n=1 Tax=Zoogloea sp. TaxID=49181 RepID=UPI002C14792E|nr:hypothetical protein [Zoogloea sp.]HMV62708.1 hypothetical protein [Rhodocyclaceae bacterium]HMY98118.1 hypothetical protein [Burkholderiaceae bacterium]HNH16409.1 hypothetical protein [Zoogloea sp.]